MTTSPTLQALRDSTWALDRKWPSDVELYQPFEMEQILVTENSVCLATRAYLKMAGLNFQLQYKANAEHMAPNGRVPLLKTGKFLFADFDNIVAHVNARGLGLLSHLADDQKDSMRTYMALTSSVFPNAEAYISFVDELTYQKVTKPRYCSVYPWPLSELLMWQKRRTAIQRLKAVKWAQKSLEDVLKEVEQCCRSLQDLLGDKQYFFNDRVTELDALVFGHIFTLLTTNLPDDPLRDVVSKYSRLVQLCNRIDQNFFGHSG